MFHVSLIYEKNKRYKEAMDYVNRARAHAANIEKKNHYEGFFDLYEQEYDNQLELERLFHTSIPTAGTADWFSYMEQLVRWF